MKILVEEDTREQPLALELDPGRYRVGDSDEDHVRVRGLRPGLCVLQVGENDLRIVTSELLSVGKAPLTPGVERLVAPGETIRLGERARLHFPDEAPGAGPMNSLGTKAILRSLLREGEPGTGIRGAKLLCLTGVDLGRRFIVGDTSPSVGRGARVDIRIRDRAVSRRHVRLTKAGPHHLLSDLGTPNGTFVNGRRVRAPTELADRDILELGETFMMYQAAPMAFEGTPTEGTDAAPEAAADTPGGRSTARSRGWEEWALMLGGVVVAAVGLWIGVGTAFSRG